MQSNQDKLELTIFEIITLRSNSSSAINVFAMHINKTVKELHQCCSKTMTDTKRLGIHQLMIIAILKHIGRA